MLEQLRVAQERLHEIIPGGVHTRARGSSKFFKAMTSVVARGPGARVEDASSSWLFGEERGRPVTLGGGYRTVVSTVRPAGMAHIHHLTVEAGVTDELMNDRPVTRAMRLCRVVSATSRAGADREESDR